MPLLTIHHKTEYRYARAVAFGEHRIMLRPRDGHDLRVLESRLDIDPEPMRLRWIHDVFGNSVAIATFDERSDVLIFTSSVTVEHKPAEEFALTPDDPAYFYPFLYDWEEFPDIVQFVTPQYSDRDGELSAWARNFLDAEAPTPTFKILSGMTYRIREAFIYHKRHEQGTQHPLDTLQTGFGTCRDYALLRSRRCVGSASPRASSPVTSSPATTLVISAAARPMPGCRSTFRAQGGSSSIRPTASSARATWCASRSRAIRARPFRCMASISVRRMRLSEWR
jgi:hypothetical protein